MPAPRPRRLTAPLVYHSAGVPLLEELMQLSVPGATARAAVLVTRALTLSAVAAAVLGAVYSRICVRERQRNDFQPLVSTTSAVSKPALVLLPYYIVAHVATVGAALLQVIASKMRPEFDVLVRGHGDAVLCAVKRVTQVLQDASELVAIAGVAWATARLKDRLVQGVRLSLLQDGGAEPSSLVRLVDGLSSALNYVIWAAAWGVGLASLGIDLRPLAASLGASSVVIGIAAQGILSNLVSGVALFTSPAFAVGDRVGLVTTGGAPVAEGRVQVITPTRTILRAENGALIYINNADLAKMIVKNESQAVAVVQ